MDAQSLMSNIETKLRHKNLKRWFDKFKASGMTKFQKETKLRSAMAGKITRFFRDAFEKWKKNAEMLEVIRFNNEEGPQAIELFHVNQDVKNLK